MISESPPLLPTIPCGGLVTTPTTATAPWGVLRAPPLPGAPAGPAGGGERGVSPTAASSASDSPQIVATSPLDRHHVRPAGRQRWPGCGVGRQR